METSEWPIRSQYLLQVYSKYAFSDVYTCDHMHVCAYIQNTRAHSNTAYIYTSYCLVPCQTLGEVCNAELSSQLTSRHCPINSQTCSGGWLNSTNSLQCKHEHIYLPSIHTRTRWEDESRAIWVTIKMMDKVYYHTWEIGCLLTNQQLFYKK